LDAAGNLFDLSQKTNFSVESLSALKNAAETSGSSIESISTALGIFQKNQEAANQGNKKLSETFQRLNIDTHSNEQGLRDAFKALSDMTEGEQQTALAMEIFGKSGKDVLGVIKETNGNLDEAIAKYKEMGTLISTETAKAADDLGDSLTSAGQKAKAFAGDLLTDSKARARKPFY
jgi:methyl-accepting chemotaxis protein